ncbi:MAG: bifunctional adenosylcobinamide kinase/adenosylcobinamide-phosphate guanylyltransferase [Hyphomicrobiaceae bacterium]|nr:bifunctional adenosylcobinamide kinase/adenosylcobinamide-phosphate guanylyltransferase [Hyphomicrobiaceae bacterium]
MTGTGKSILVIGGARSGKSRYAEALAAAWTGPKIYFATAEPGDEEMAARIAAHQARRGDDWRTVTALLNLPDALRAHSDEDAFILIDCLTIWLSNVFLAKNDCAAAVEDFLEALAHTQGMTVLVSNEVGGGIVPDNAMAREFRDIAGETNQKVAAIVDEVVLVTAGLPQVLKPSTK